MGKMIKVKVGEQTRGCGLTDNIPYLLLTAKFDNNVMCIMGGELSKREGVLFHW